VECLADENPVHRAFLSFTAVHKASDSPLPQLAEQETAFVRILKTAIASKSFIDVPSIQ
jgi:hypothetical protein